MTDTLKDRIATAITLNHPVGTTADSIVNANDIAATVMEVLNDPVLPVKEGVLRAEPANRMERIVNSMTDHMDAHPEHHEGDKCVIFLSDEHMGGMVAHGYDDNGEDSESGRMVTAAIVDVMLHLRAMFRAIGKDLELIALPEIPADIGGLFQQGESS